MTTVLNPSEEAQLVQTIEMFEVITQSQPYDYQSLEILKEAYSKLGREQEVINASKRIAKAYMHLGQLSSAILEYETILQRVPDDAEVQAALAEIESRAGNLPAQARALEPMMLAKPAKPATPAARPAAKPPGWVAPAEIEDGRKDMYRVFVEGKIIAVADFDAHWHTPDPTALNGVVEPFIQVLADKKILPVEKSLKALADRTRAAFLPLDKYDVDLDLARTFPPGACQRWCVLPFDHMSKSTLVATANPFNQQALHELSEANASRLIWYLAPPVELIKNLRKAFRL